jgi:phosphate-selective porin O/P
VASEIPRSWAICLLRRPCTTWTIISRSRGLSESKRALSIPKAISFSRRARSRARRAAGTLLSITETRCKLLFELVWGFVAKYDDFRVNVTPDFGNNPDGNPTLFEANVNYTGIKPLTFTVGYTHPFVSLEDATFPGNLLFLERPSIVIIERDVAAGLRSEGTRRPRTISHPPT